MRMFYIVMHVVYYIICYNIILKFLAKYDFSSFPALFYCKKENIIKVLNSNDGIRVSNSETMFNNFVSSHMSSHFLSL
jgi:hypothetical protein